ncbi:MAG TPA: hypothetical protein VK980_16005, partial [Sphingomonas sp.]|nr:hypothetical protein [Sphingomonas sp.]
MPFSNRNVSAPKPIEDNQGGPLVVNWNTLLDSEGTQGFTDSQVATGNTQSTQALTPIAATPQSLTPSGGNISLTTDGAAYTQNFDTLSNTAGSTTNELSIAGWAMIETGLGARDNDQYAVDTGGSTTGDTYSYGAAAATDRALGSLRSGTLIPVFGAGFTNNTGATITSLDIAYTGEEWRLGTAARAIADGLTFSYSLDATDLTNGTW